VGWGITISIEKGWGCVQKWEWTPARDEELKPSGGWRRDEMEVRWDNMCVEKAWSWDF
jgi:hypothetical protein